MIDTDTQQLTPEQYRAETDQKAREALVNDVLEPVQLDEEHVEGFNETVFNPDINAARQKVEAARANEFLRPPSGVIEGLTNLQPGEEQQVVPSIHDQFNEDTIRTTLQGGDAALTRKAVSEIRRTQALNSVASMLGVDTNNVLPFAAAHAKVTAYSLKSSGGALGLVERIIPLKTGWGIVERVALPVGGTAEYDSTVTVQRTL
jgi:hypothetical protein